MSDELKPKANPNDELVRLMLRREQADLEQIESKRQTYERRNEAQKKSDKEMELAEQRRIVGCSHRKGQSSMGGKVRTPVVDYSLFIHTFINEVTVIRCTQCGGEWAQGTTKDVLIHYDGRKEPNFTHLSFEDMLQKASESTNQPSRAEIPFNRATDLKPAAASA